MSIYDQPINCIYLHIDILSIVRVAAISFYGVTDKIIVLLRHFFQFIDPLDEKILRCDVGDIIASQNDTFKELMACQFSQVISISLNLCEEFYHRIYTTPNACQSTQAIAKRRMRIKSSNRNKANRGQVPKSQPCMIINFKGLMKYYPKRLIPDPLTPLGFERARECLIYCICNLIEDNAKKENALRKKDVLSFHSQQNQDKK